MTNYSRVKEVEDDHLSDVSDGLATYILEDIMRRTRWAASDKIRISDEIKRLLIREQNRTRQRLEKEAIASAKKAMKVEKQLKESM